MSNAMLSLMGMYSWDDTLFDDMSFPESFTQEAKEVFVNNLLMECAELEVLYTDWNFLKFAIDNWSAKEVISWNRYYAAMAAQYNPIQNYDRTELTTDTHSGSVTHSGTDSVTGSGNDSDVATGTDTDTTSRTGYDSNTYQAAEKLEMGKNTTITHNKNSTDTTRYGHIITDTTGITRSSHISGNIGVTTSQQMLESELELIPKLNVINTMIESFKNRFCLIVY